MTDYLFVDLQGFKSSENEFIVKEFGYSTNDYTQSFLIKPPFAFFTLSEWEKRRVRWIEKNLGILWREGYVDFREFKRIIVTHLQHKKIFVKGNEKIKWVKDLCADCNVVDIGEMNAPSFGDLYKKYCLNGNVNCVNHKKKCVLKNVICIKTWYLDNVCKK
jgi:hypothetical protein